MSKLNEIHSKGEQDGAKNVSNPPNTTFDLLVAPKWREPEIIKENEAYQQGFNNGYQQRK